MNQKPSTQLVPHHEKINSMRAQLSRGKDELAKILPKHMSPDAMLRLALTAAVQSPKLLDCSIQSVGLALMTAGSLGLEPNGYDGHLVPYGRVCQFIPDYKGLVKLAYQSEGVSRVMARAIREKDDLDYQEGTGGFIHHRITLNIEDDDERGELIGAWAMFELADGTGNFVVMPKSQILKRKRASPASSKPDSPWQKWPDEMWAKTALKQLAKFAPLGRTLQVAAKHDSLAEAGKIGVREMEAALPEGVRNPYAGIADPSESTQDASGAEGDANVENQDESDSGANSGRQTKRKGKSKRSKTPCESLIDKIGKMSEAAELDHVRDGLPAEGFTAEEQTLILDALSERRMELLNIGGESESAFEAFGRDIERAETMEELETTQKRMVSAQFDRALTMPEYKSLMSQFANRKKQFA